MNIVTKSFLIIAISTSLFSFNCKSYAQTAPNQVRDATPLATVTSSGNTSSVPDAQLMSVINQTSNVATNSTEQPSVVSKTGPSVKPAIKSKVATSPSLPTSSTKPTTTTPSLAKTTAVMTPTHTTAPMQQAKTAARQMTNPTTTSVAATSTSVTPTSSVAMPTKSNQTQIELDLNKKVAYKIFYLDKPYRLVVDINDSSFSAEFDKSAFANSLIKNIRTAHRDNGIFRVVFDLKAPVTFQHFEQVGNSSPESMKLVIEMTTI